MSQTVYPAGKIRSGRQIGRGFVTVAWEAAMVAVRQAVPIRCPVML
ncbi:hypothetical protein [Neisseria leonii]|nr:hypothetical protein [Neisseria sp. 3986]MDD9325821.1 hypothetical protein [Neisseria sp. 3986]